MEERVRQLREISVDPVRLDIMEALRDEGGPLASSEIERRVPAARGGIDTHLARLGDAGWIQVVDGEGRKARWEVAGSGVAWSATDTSDPLLAEAINELSWVALQRRITRLRKFDGERQAGGIWSEEWLDASIGVDYLARMSPEDVAEFEAEFAAMVQRYRERGRSSPHRVFITLSAFPIKFGE